MSTKKNAVFAYIGLHVFYLGEVSMTAGFAVLFLSSRGLSNTAIGTATALARMLSIFAVKSLSQRLDADKKLMKTIFPAAAGMLLLLHILLVFTGRSLALTCAVFTGVSLLSALCGSLLVILYADLEFAGSRINFGLSRGLGSLSYTAVSYVAGGLVAVRSPEIVPIIGILASAGLFVDAFLLCTRIRPAETAPEKDAGNGAELLGYIRSRKGLGIFFTGVLLLFTAYYAGNSFAVNMIRSIGGSGHELGTYNALGALIEVPFMIFFSKASVKNSRFLFRVSLLLMTGKALILALSRNMAWVYGAAVLQGSSYGLYTPAAVNYIKSRTSYANAAKGQSVISIASSLGGVCGMLIAGRLLDLLPVRDVLLLLTAVSAAGAATLWIATERISSET